MQAAPVITAQPTHRNRQRTGQNTGWEPAAVYTHLERLERLAAPAGIPIGQVSTGDIRADVLNPAHRFARSVSVDLWSGFPFCPLSTCRHLTDHASRALP